MPFVLAGLHYHAPPAPSTTARARLKLNVLTAHSEVRVGFARRWCVVGVQHARVRRVYLIDVLRAQRERKADKKLETANTRQNGVRALPLDALLCVLRCSAHASRAPHTMLKRYDALQPASGR